MNIYKNGVLLSDNIYESNGTNILIPADIGSSYVYTPGTGNNSCVTGFTVDYSSCNLEEKVYISIKIEWSGFDSSNTNGTFNSWFQGSTYNAVKGAWEWGGRNNVTTALNSVENLGTLLLSSTSGIRVITASCTINSDYPITRTMEHVGIRTDYSNGIGVIKISDLMVIPEKYYVNPAAEGVSLHIGKDYISAGEIYEF